ncbi:MULTISPECIES: hypothetical protein [Myxococcus]|uniref:Lipoprotein n=1 Tax=Myxococcus llanfairpwllgwyngyllgogerychwyrndrobwllllantysiliogogogochensis TaxID=2590453 RepID=A0A540X6Y9_9BACT|nr:MULTISPECIES: hypothetical protein [Myxococcus]NTX08253.1 hypothetical protein [Myxococcus sp. CA040A]TQF17066.1 hypothetical protein FJV41_05185 [Myxococcus llanfairpwllgwyngyllgogerychwyrndrobwllllantysiliogogogochensis]
MQAGRFVSGALLAVGLMLAGCGGAAVEDTEAQDLTSREDAVPNCNGIAYDREYYSDASYSTLVGTRSCDCSNYGQWGRVTAFVITYNYTCG